MWPGVKHIRVSSLTICEQALLASKDIVMTNNGPTSRSNDNKSSSTGDTGKNKKWKNNHSNKEKKFVSKSKLSKMKGKVVIQDGGNKSFKGRQDVFTTFAKKTYPILVYNIKEMITLTKGEMFKTKVNFS